MGEKTIFIIAAALVLVAAAVVILMVRNTRNSSLQKDVEDINVRFNALKSVPLAFKLNKAQAMAKRNDQTSSAVEEYYAKYEEAQKHLDQIQEMMNNLDDSMASRKYHEAQEALKIIGENISDSEKEIADIDQFLETFSKKESLQREYSTKLKEEYRELKLGIENKANVLSVAYEGLMKKLNKCEELFSSSEEWMYGNDFHKAQENLTEISDNLAKIKASYKDIPDLVKDVKGVLPVMLDEVNRQYALSRQRGIYLDHLEIDKKISEVGSNLSADLKTLGSGETTDVKEHIEASKKVLSETLETLKDENKAYKDVKDSADQILENVSELDKLENYVRVAYEKDSARYGLDNLREYLDKQRSKNEEYKYSYKQMSEDISSNIKPASTISKEVLTLLENTESDRKELANYKAIIDKSTSDEERAINQLMKLQVVINEVEVKVKEYHLPTIASTYADDLAKGKEYIAKIKTLLSEIPLNISELNTTLDEAIDFIYKFYNNVNNIVGMAIMVENAIVFGNKYRSTYPEVDRELSKAEFSYLNGEYTRALRVAINCMESLFPNSLDEKILENS